MPAVMAVRAIPVLPYLVAVAVPAAATASRLRQNLTLPESPHNSLTLPSNADAHGPYAL